MWAHPTVTSASCPEKSSTGTLNQFCVFSNQRPWPQILLRAKPFLRLFPILSFLRKQTEHMFLGLLPTRWVGVTINFYARWLPNVSKYLRWGLAGLFVLWSSGFGHYQSSWNNFQAKSEPKFPSEFFFPTAVPKLQKAQHSSPCLVPAPRHHQGSAATNMVTMVHPSICCFSTAQQKQFMKVMPHTGRYAERHCKKCFYFFQRSIRRQREGVGILFPISICSCCCSACKITLLNLWHPAWLLWK